MEILATGWPDIYWSLSWKFRKTAAEKSESLRLMEMESKGTAQKNTNTTTATERLESNMQHRDGIRSKKSRNGDTHGPVD